MSFGTCMKHEKLLDGIKVFHRKFLILCKKFLQFLFIMCIFIYIIHYQFNFYFFYLIIEFSCPEYFSKLPFDNRERCIRCVSFIVFSFVKMSILKLLNKINLVFPQINRLYNNLCYAYLRVRIIHFTYIYNHRIPRMWHCSVSVRNFAVQNDFKFILSLCPISIFSFRPRHRPSKQ